MKITIVKLYEYQAKTLFQQFGIIVPMGCVIDSLEQAEHILPMMRFPIMVKGQLLAGGRAKHDAIKTAHTIPEAKVHITTLLNAQIDGLSVDAVLLEEHITSSTYYYVGIVNDRNARKPVLVASVEYGAEIEEIVKKAPHLVAQQHIDPLTGLHSYQSLHIADDLNFPKQLWRKFDEIAQALYQCYRQKDATLAEINPIAYTYEHGFIALDGKIKIDDNALYRQPEIRAWQETRLMDEAESLAHQAGISYVRLDGKLAVSSMGLP